MLSSCIELLLMFILCPVSHTVPQFSVYHLIFLLAGFVLVCFELIAVQPAVRKGIGVCTVAVCLPDPYLLVFTPFFSYLFFKRKQYIFPALLFILYWILYPEPCFRSGVFLTVLTGLSFYLAGLSGKQEELRLRVKQMRDAGVEQEMKLKSQNRQLEEQQNDALYIATLQERNRIAREIHDNVGHILSRSILQIGALLAVCKDETLKPHLITLKDTLNEAMTSIRNSVHDLHDEAVRLDESIRDIVQSFTFCPVKFTYSVSSRMPKNTKYCFLAIIREALNNVMKHSNATAVELSVREHSGFYQLIIEDNGTNGTGKEPVSDTGGIGLTGMRERVAANHGVIHITADHGFRIFVTVPKG